MNFKNFIEEAKRTESELEHIVVNDVIFNHLKATMTDLMDCFDMIKKKTFYGKDIDTQRFMARLTVAQHDIVALREKCKVDETFINGGVQLPMNPREFHGILGLLTEAGEALELLNLNHTKVDPLKIADELGDAFWYIAILADEKGIDIEQQVLEGVIAKLRQRFPDKFEAALAVTRDKEAELAKTAEVTGIGDVAETPPEEEKKVNKGGRPRKDATKKPAPKNKGGRPRKKPVEKEVKDEDKDVE